MSTRCATNHRTLKQFVQSLTAKTIPLVMENREAGQALWTRFSTTRGPGPRGAWGRARAPGPLHERVRTGKLAGP